MENTPAGWPKRPRAFLLAGLFSWLLMPAAGQADEPPAPLSVEAHGLVLKVTPLSAEQKTAFYLARGFTAAEIEPYARACGFSFSLENREQPLLRYRLVNWSIEAEGRVRRFVLPSDWDREWERRGLGASPRIAFRWAQFPAEQEFARGDWIMGMASLLERPAGPLRILARIDLGEQTLELPIDSLFCAPLD